MSLLHKKTFCVVTGASRGIGRTVAIKMAQHLGMESVLVLLARSASSLEDVKKIIQASDECVKLNLKVIIRVFDQGSDDQEEFDKLFPGILHELQMKECQFNRAIIVHNVGTLEGVKYCKNLENLLTTRQFFNVNITGMITLNAKFLQTFPEHSKEKLIINMSSLAAIEPIKSWALYNTVKAGRDMYFRVLAAEEPNIRVLNYAPGPVDTEMFNVITTETEDPEIRETFKKMKENKKLLSCEITIDKLMKLLKENQFKNGAHVDFYDEI